MGEGPIVEATDADETFATLSDATRIAIVSELGEASDRAVTFSDLRERVGVNDSGQFNYHLQRLTDQFVAETDDGYRLTVAGRRVYGALLAGRYTKAGATDPIPLDERCPACGGERVFRYDGERARVECQGCDMGTFFGVPPGVFAGYETERWPAVAERYARTVIRRADDGFCPACDGPMRTEVVEHAAMADPDVAPPDSYREHPTVRYACDRCGEEVACDMGVGLLGNPAVVAFYYDHGVDVESGTMERFRTIGSAHPPRVVGRDPLRVRVRYTADGGTLTLVVDDELTVLDTERSDG